MTDSPREPLTMRRVGIVVRGVVQGVGFRPFVYRTAKTLGLSGWVQNEADLVRIEIAGPAASVAALLDSLEHAAPPQARIDAVEVAELPPAARATPTFEIRPSAAASDPRPTIPADLATCDACLAEIRDPAQRRYGYPFTNCTNCGPRWSIIRELPYDRSRTSMAQFTMCPDCRAEYEDPGDRRFHAQPIACPRCGPQLTLHALGLTAGLSPPGATAGLSSSAEGPTDTDPPAAVGPSALDAAAQAILAGQIVAMKGLGGFQLLVDATCQEAVRRLRLRKHRPDRPLAVMFPSLESVRECCEVSTEEARALASHEAPILLLGRRAGQGKGTVPFSGQRFASVSENRDSPPSDPIAEAVSPGNPQLGVMLPYTPLHHLLMAAVARPVVCTSGNLSEEPMAIDADDARRRLGPIADWLLTHDRPIVRPVDDSVARMGPDGLQVFRRARGYAPLSIAMRRAAPTILAVGGHLKNTVALAVGSQGPTTPIVLSQHVGDLDSLASVDVFRRAIDDLVGFFRVVPAAVACDLHPDYASTRRAEELAAQWRVPLVRVQHHHAHVAACMAEHGLEGPVLGLSWDGTGYGPDGTIWGGEAMVCVRGEFHRVARLRTFRLPGGDRAVRQPRRSALGLLYEILGDEAGQYADDGFEPVERKAILQAMARGVNAPRTSSVGRLFDAVASLCGLRRDISFEGQAAMELEFAADPAVEETYPLPLRLTPDSAAVADWEPMIRAVLADRRAGQPVGRISARFHNALADLAVAVARRAGCPQVVLTGGCFQNALLTHRVRGRLLDAGFTVLVHRQVPPGDGGIALGQVFVAAWQLQAGEPPARPGVVQ